MTLDKNSRGSIISVLILCGLLIWLSIVKIRSPWLMWPAVTLLLAFATFNTLFFRVPRRQKAGNEHSVSAVADGKIVIIEKVYEPEFLKRECIQVSIYMDFFDVHANFWPVTGEITYFRYYPGEHLLAFKPKASEENEHSCTCIRTAAGKDVFFKQIAGTFARRIVSYSTLGGLTTAGEQCGIIKFGSRIDLYLPADADIKVTLGQQVKACETVIAEI